MKEGKQSNEGFMLNGGRKSASGETEFTGHLPFLRGVSLIQGLSNEIRAWNYGYMSRGHVHVNACIDDE